MPYNADIYPQHQHHGGQQYPQNQAASHQYAAQSPPQYVPLEAVIPQYVPHQQQAYDPGYQVNHLVHPQQSYPLPPRPPQGPPQQFYQDHNRQLIAPQHQALPPSHPSVSVEIPARVPRDQRGHDTDSPDILLCLADEYLTAAYSEDMQEALATGKARPDDYHRLVATALGCMETVLYKFRLHPVQEALLRLHFATTLFDETENELETEICLSKGIDLCDRNKLADLKYSMQVLLTRVLYQKRPKVAIKALDGIIEDVVAYKHTAWEYAFRILRANMSLSMGSHQDNLVGIHELQRVIKLAQKRGDPDILSFAAATQALAYLKISDPDSVNQAQTALAVARQFQSSSAGNIIPQVQVLLHYVDLCCGLQQLNQEQIGQQLAAMQQALDQILDDTRWQDDGTFELPLVSSSSRAVPSLGAGIVNEKAGNISLNLSWLPKTDVYAIGYLLSAIGQSCKSSPNDKKTETFLEEGLSLLRNSLGPATIESESMTSSTVRTSWRRLLELQILLEKVFMLCGRSGWEKASQILVETKRILGILPKNVAPDLLCLQSYLSGCVCQGTGDVNQALAIFLSKELGLPPNCNKASHHNIPRDISLLAAMNAILIIRSPSHPSHNLLPTILTKIDPYLLNSPNKHILASRSLLISILPISTHDILNRESLSSTLLVKKHLGNALNIAKTIGNTQITAVTLSVMSAKFFKGVVGDQAEKSARAGQNMAWKSGMKMWISVSNGTLAETLERQGKREEAQKWKQVALKMAAQMPKELQRFEGQGLRVTGGEDDDRDELA